VRALREQQAKRVEDDHRENLDEQLTAARFARCLVRRCAENGSLLLDAFKLPSLRRDLGPRRAILRRLFKLLRIPAIVNAQFGPS
jgi:hypothetical protein